MTLLLLLTLLAISLACAFYGTSLLMWTVAMAAGIVILASTGSVPLFSLAVIAAIFAVIAIPLNVDSLAPAIDQRAVPQAVPAHAS